MENITSFCATSDIKPEIAKIYIHDIDCVKYAVCTDSFRLAQYKLPDLLQTNMPAGYYTPKAYKEIMKAYNKKNKDIKLVLDTIAGQTVLQEQYKHYKYPEYTQIIPKADTLKDFTGSLDIKKEYFIDFINLIPFDRLTFKDIKETEKIIVYKNDTILLLVMALNNYMTKQQREYRTKKQNNSTSRHLRTSTQANSQRHTQAKCKPCKKAISRL